MEQGVDIIALLSGALIGAAAPEGLRAELGHRAWFVVLLVASPLALGYALWNVDQLAAGTGEIRFTFGVLTAFGLRGLWLLGRQWVSTERKQASDWAGSPSSERYDS